MARPTTLSDLAKLQELKAEAIRQVDALNSVAPDVARALVKELADLLNVRLSGPASAKAAEPSTYDRVATALRDNDNKPMTKADLSTKAGVSEGSLHTILYASHHANFVRGLNPTGGKGKVFSLKPEFVSVGGNGGGDE